MSNTRSRRKRKSNLTAAGGTGAGAGGGSESGVLSERLAGITVKLAEKVFQLEKEVYQRLSRLEQASRAMDYRTLAVQRLLSKVGITEGDISAKIEDLQVEDFNSISAKDDSAKGLISADDGELDATSVAIVTIQYRKDGQEVANSRVLRSKIEVSAAETISPQLKEALSGKRVGDVVEFSVAEGVTGTASILGIRKKSAQPQEGSSN